MTGPIDPSASVLMPSYHPYTTNGIAWAQAFLYCTGANAGSNCDKGGSATTDIINFHMKPGTQYPAKLESTMDAWTSAVRGILQPNEATKPFFLTETGYAAGGFTAPYTLDLNEAAYIARLYIYDYYKGYAANIWYDYTTNNGLNGLGSIAADNAYSQIYSEMVGATGLACSARSNGSGDAAQPSLYVCTFTEVDGTPAQWMWDADNSGEPGFWDSGASNNLECHSGVCPTLPQSVPGTMQSYVDLTGAKTSITNGQVPVGIRPILVQAKP